MIVSICEMLFSVLCDIVYIQSGLDSQYVDLDSFQGFIDYVFQLLCNVCMLCFGVELKIVVCWGGYLISSEEYKYIKRVGYEFGLCSLDVCIGCGLGVMKGLMKGVIISYVKQCIVGGCYLGLIELGIIVVEVLNLIVNELVILLDIEKCLEVFVCVGYGVIIFFGGVGIVEEFFYLLGIFMYLDNQDLFFLVIFIGFCSVEVYLQQFYEFVGVIFGYVVQCYYWIVIDDLVEVVKQMVQGLKEVKQFCCECNDVFYFNWMLKIDESFQCLFELIYENMVSFQFSCSLLFYELVVNLCCVFFGIVVGNVKDNGICMIE